MRERVGAWESGGGGGGAELRSRRQMGRRKLCGDEWRENMGWRTMSGRWCEDERDICGTLG